jgi:hypothetical protein
VTALCPTTLAGRQPAQPRITQRLELGDREINHALDGGLVGCGTAYTRVRAAIDTLDEVDLVPGQIWKEEIPKAIRQAGVFVACLSRMGSTEAERQWAGDQDGALFVDREKPQHHVKQLFALAYNLANFLRSLLLPKEVAQWSLTTLREKLVKIGARIVRHGRYVIFQLAEVAVPRTLFAEILRRIDRLRGPPVPAT